MTPADFEFIASLLYKRSGLVLTPDKIYLLESRLTPLARQNGHGSLQDLIGAIRRTPREDLLVEVTEAMTTNESFFFRDKTPFEQFEKVMMPALTAARPEGRPIRIWCAASSTGQEPYSLSILLKDKPALAGGRSVDIEATDLSEQVLERAREGVYTQFEVQRGLPVQLLVKHFEKAGTQWRIREDLRAMVTFSPLNLLNDFSKLGTFDIIFCRNVLIYFDRETKGRVLDRLADRLAPDGFLVLGAAETVFGLSERFAPCEGQRGLYGPVPKGAGAVPSQPRAVNQ